MTFCVLSFFSCFLALHLKGGINSCELIWTSVDKFNTISLYGDLHFHPTPDHFFSRIWPFSVVVFEYQAVCSWVVQFSPADLLIAMFCSGEICSFATISNLDFISLPISQSISNSFLCQIQDYYIEQNTSFLKTAENSFPVSTWIFFCLWKWRGGLVAYSTKRHKSKLSKSVSPTQIIFKKPW